MREKGLNLCHLCHKFIHKKFSEKELGRDYNNLDSLTSNPIIKKYMEENKIRIVLDKSSILLGDSTLDITDPVIKNFLLDLFVS